MRRIVLFCVCAVLAGGCAGRKAASTGPARPAGSPPGSVGAASQTNRSHLIMTSSAEVQGRVASVNPNARYAVISFPIGALPALQQRMQVYRGGLKVAEIKITGPQIEFNIIGDIVDGECQVGDTVRQN